MTDSTAKTPPLWIESYELSGGEHGGIQLTSSASRKVAVQVSDEMLSGVRDSLRNVWSIVSEAMTAANQPDEVVVKFGLKLAAKAGASAFVIVSEAEGEATFALEATWKRRPGSEAVETHA
jgi:hypothetical protein